MSKKILEVKELSKTFKRVHAVKGISFDLEEGDIFAFLGPNGAGKTTTLRILLDIIKADSGQISWNLNGNSSSLPASSLIGYLPEERGLYLDLPVLRTLVYMGAIRGMKQSEAKKEAMMWLERLELGKRANEKLQTLSKGNQQKVQFVASIIHKPAFAILDEPFSGLDPLNQELFIGYIKELNKQGSTILLSSHQMQLVEKIARKVFLINKGKEVFYGQLGDIYQNSAEQHTLEVSFNNHLPRETFETLEGAENTISEDAGKVKITFRQGMTISEIMRVLAGVDSITGIRSHNSNLHDIFLDMIQQQKS